MYEFVGCVSSGPGLATNVKVTVETVTATETFVDFNSTFFVPTANLPLNELVLRAQLSSFWGVLPSDVQLVQESPAVNCKEMHFK